ncbi:PQQ-binding-like beta-propeller repeat protein [Paraburkholderia sp. Tr-20389]|uniref:PQQ-binding-like beta-propeller repeat protein n=1 Tax=Paraburkholderia sp. Tr-20389 TaxID=2703903 RepID=UPI00197D771B|nr:PQQ-binding-like beta-propeller repeat protein [Paraburkholderia sp. Tr-20389]MBN3759150.1 PQQ-binding-like beta-propeller repeat protein [Paraburkholderia sp. Tr-20389]
MHRQPSMSLAYATGLAPRSVARASKAVVAVTLALFCTACGNGSSNNSGTSSSGASGNAGTGSGGSSPSTSTVAFATDVLMHHNDLARTGQMLAETTLTPANVNTSSFGKVAFLAADGKVDGQPLSVTSLSIGGVTHNVIYVVTEHNSVYAYDADNNAQLWKVSLTGANETPSDNRGCNDITPEIGITSTPVIDRNRGPNGVLYAVAMTKDASGGYHHRLHALDLASGAELLGGPSEISATYPGSGGNSVNGVLTFDPSLHTERVALTLVNGNIFMGWTAHCMAGAYTGWIMSYSADTLQQTGVVNVAPNGHQGSVWMAGSGMASDGTSIYVVDGNGTFGTTLDANGFPVDSDYGNSFMKLSASPLKVTDYFAPLDVVQLANADGDFGSGGAMLLPDVTTAGGTIKHLAVAAGKDNKIYVVDRDAMGKFSATSNAIWQVLTGTLAGGIWGSPAWFNGTVYYGALNDNIKALPVTNALLATTAASKSPTTFPYPGATPAISANGTSNGILWAAENGTTGALHAYDAANLARELYNSNQAGTRDQWGAGNKFITPTISRGKVYVGTTNGVAVFGLLH